MDARWILFEAGALSKGLTKSRVCPLLVNLPPSELKPPLSQFNCATILREDMLKLLTSVNTSSGSTALANDKLQKAFHKWWEDFSTNLAKIVKEFKPLKETHRRPVEDMVEELLAIGRFLQSQSQTQAKAQDITHILQRLSRMEKTRARVQAILAEIAADPTHDLAGRKSELENTVEALQEVILEDMKAIS
jgi:hypothetical protein